MGSREKTEYMYKAERMSNLIGQERASVSDSDAMTKRESIQHKKEDIPPLVRQVVSCPVVTMTMHDCHTSKFSSLLVQAIQKDCNPHTYKGRLCSSWMPAGIDDQPKSQVLSLQYGTVSSHNDGCGDILSSTLPPSMLSTASEPSDDISSCKRSECPSVVPSSQKSHVPSRSFADSVSTVPSSGGAPSPPASRSDDSPTISSAPSDDPSASKFTKTTMFMKISSSNSRSIFSRNYFSDSFADASSSSFSRLHLWGARIDRDLWGARIDRALGELELDVLFGGATPPQYG